MLPPTMKSKYAVELFREGGVYAGIEAVFGDEKNLKTALVFYKLMVAHYPRRLIMLRAGARVLARSDHPETISR